jgi:GDP-L-fucose synthase
MKVDRVLVTGSDGFLGQNLQAAQVSDKFNWLLSNNNNANLLNRSETMNLFRAVRPKVVLHMAAACGGIGANKKSPADFVELNSLMTCHVFDAARSFGVEYMYTLGSVCAYPKHCPVPFREDDIWNGYPEETNAPYGTAKRLQLVMQTAYRDQYGMKGAHLVPVNLFGPHDHFDLQNSHVIPALIRKMVEGKDLHEPDVEIWGTGKATREFLYAGDCAEALIKAVETNLDYPGPINLGTGKDISIRELAELIRELVGYHGELVFRGDAIDGQPKRQLDVSRAREVLGFEAQTDLRTGLKKTIDWYLECYEGND